MPPSKKRTVDQTATAGEYHLTVSRRGHEEPTDGVQTDDDLNEPTMEEKLASFNLTNDEVKIPEIERSSPQRKPPRADSVYVLLKQALRADDRALLIECLNKQDEKVVANSVSLLNPSDVFKFLEFLISILETRGAVLVCALPWLRSLLLQHASCILSQESSLRALNTLYQLIEARISTFKPALQLSSQIDLLNIQPIDDVDENETIKPVIFEDRDSDEEESEGASEAEEEDEELVTGSDVSDLEGSDAMSEE